MTYYLAPSLVSLRDEINRAHPNRDKTSDGWVGDTAHAARVSDHNPDYGSGGVVRAIDVDKDGIDTAKLLRIAIASPSTEYVIWNRRIYGRWSGFKAEVYTGTNPHDKHMHISIRHTKTAEAARKWGYYGSTASTPTKPTYTAAQITARTEANIGTIVDDVIAGKYGTSTQWPGRIKAANYDVDVVRDGIARRRAAEEAERIASLTPAERKARTEANIGRLVDEVLAGDWGNNPDRSARLLKAGWSPVVVQEGVVRRLGTTTAPVVRLSNAAIAKQVVEGQWGNWPEREQRLTAAGYDYAAIQTEVEKLV